MHEFQDFFTSKIFIGIICIHEFLHLICHINLNVWQKIPKEPEHTNFILYTPVHTSWQIFFIHYFLITRYGGAHIFQTDDEETMIENWRSGWSQDAGREARYFCIPYPNHSSRGQGSGSSPPQLEDTLKMSILPSRWLSVDSLLHNHFSFK